MSLPLEISANALTTVSILLAGRNSVHTWWTGIVGCFLFALLFHRANLYADVLLQLFFVISSAIGWWHWLRGHHGSESSISSPPLSSLALPLVFGALGTIGYGALLHRFTDAYAPFVDSAVLAFSIVAQLLLMRRILHTWPCWLLVNSVAVPLYTSRGLYLTAVLYAFYWINALVSFRHWRKLVRAQAPVARVERSEAA